MPACFVLAERDGYESERRYPGFAGDTILLTKLPHARGRVTGPDGAPVAGARVVIVTSDEYALTNEVPWDERKTLVSETRTSADGTFDVTFHALQHDFHVAVSAPGLATWVIQTSESEVVEKPLEIALVASLNIEGRVVCTGTDEGVGGLDVAIVSASGSESGRVRRPDGERVVAVTAPDGAFRVEGVAPSTQALRIAGAGWIAAVVEADRLAAKDLRVEVEPALTLAGRAQFDDGRARAVPDRGADARSLARAFGPEVDVEERGRGRRGRGEWDARTASGRAPVERRRARSASRRTEVSGAEGRHFRPTPVRPPDACATSAARPERAARPAAAGPRSRAPAARARGPARPQARERVPSRGP